jgi:hypothetical protein
MSSRRAILIATDVYEDSGLKQLQAPAGDAARLADLLRESAIGNFTDVEVLHNEGADVVRRQLARFMENRESDDFLLIYVAGHGVKQAGELYFATGDTDLSILAASSISASFVNHLVDRSRARRVVMLLDCCYSGAFARGMAPRGADAIDLNDQFGGDAGGTGRAVLTASTATELAFEAGKPQGEGGLAALFTDAVIKGLESGDADDDNDGRITVAELSKYVRRHVRARNPDQTPTLWLFDTQGEMVIALRRPPEGQSHGGCDDRDSDSSSQAAGILAGPTAVHVGGAVAITGATAVIASLPAGGPNQHNVGYWLPVAVMSAGVIVLIGYALRANQRAPLIGSRRAPLIGGTALALALLGVTFPLSWHAPHTNFTFPDTAHFWLGACGAALAALGAALASWQMYAEPPIRPREPAPTWSRATRVLLTMPGPLIVISSLLFLDEWSRPFPAKPAWQNASDSIKRYPSAMILLCAFVVALAAAGIRSNRTRLLVIAAGVACLVLGESVPLIFTGAGHWGPGRWLAIAGAVLAVAGLALAAARSGEAVPQRPRGDQPRP